MVYYLARRYDFGLKDMGQEKPRLLPALVAKGALPLGVPVVIIGGIVGGVFTPTESAAIAIFYVLMLSVFVYRELPMILSDSPLALTSAVSRKLTPDSRAMACGRPLRPMFAHRRSSSPGRRARPAGRCDPGDGTPSIRTGPLDRARGRSPASPHRSTRRPGVR